MDDKKIDIPAQTVAASIKQSENLPAMVSIRTQEFRDLYDAEEGFDYGTVFLALNKPFLAGGK